MKLIRFGEKGNEKPGVLINGNRKDCSTEFMDWNREFFQNNGLDKLKELLEEKGDILPNVTNSVRHAACIERPGTILCVGLNYSEHAQESKMELPKEPIVFGKTTNTISGPYDDIVIPKNSEKTDYELELGVILKSDVYKLANEEEAMNAIAGYCIVNDVSERSYQLERGGQWIKGKSCPGFCPTGPFMATPDELPPVDNLDLQLTVNGEIRQNSNTEHMIFKPAFIIHHLSQFMVLEAGTLIATGTPSGVALGLGPDAYLKKDDTVELTISGLGYQKQKFI